MIDQEFIVRYAFPINKTLSTIFWMKYYDLQFDTNNLNVQLTSVTWIQVSKTCKINYAL